MADDPIALDAPLGFDTARTDLDALVESQRRMNTELATAAQLGSAFGRTLTTAFLGLAVQGKSFGDVLSTLALSLSRLALNAAFKPLEGVFAGAFQSVMSAPSPVSGASLATPVALASPIAFGSPRMDPVSATAVGQGTSQAPLSVRGAPQIVLNIQTPDADSFRRSETQLAALLARAAAQGQRNL